MYWARGGGKKKNAPPIYTRGGAIRQWSFVCQYLMRKLVHRFNM